MSTKHDAARWRLLSWTPDHTSVDAYRSLRARFPQSTLAPTHNEMLGPAQHRDKYPIAGSGQVMIRLPVLAPGLRKYIETPPFSFSAVRPRRYASQGPGAYPELARWLRRIYLGFRELDLRLFLADLQLILRQS